MALWSTIINICVLSCNNHENIITQNNANIFDNDFYCFISQFIQCELNGQYCANVHNWKKMAVTHSKIIDDQHNNMQFNVECTLFSVQSFFQVNMNCVHDSIDQINIDISTIHVFSK